MFAVHGTIKPSPDPRVHSDLELDSRLLQNPHGAARCLLCLEVGGLMETVLGALPLRSESQVCPLFLLLFNVVREAGAKRNKNNGHKA